MRRRKFAQFPHNVAFFGFSMYFLALSNNELNNHPLGPRRGIHMKHCWALHKERAKYPSISHACPP